MITPRLGFHQMLTAIQDTVWHSEQWEGGELDCRFVLQFSFCNLSTTEGWYCAWIKVIADITAFSCAINFHWQIIVKNSSEFFVLTVWFLYCVDKDPLLLWPSTIVSLVKQEILWPHGMFLCDWFYMFYLFRCTVSMALAAFMWGYLKREGWKY